MSNSNVRIAVVGAGLAGQAHAFGFRNAAMATSSVLPSVELVTIVDPNINLAEKVAHRYGFASATADLDAVLADPSIDAVSVALPNFAHAEVLPKVIASGKHLFAEKPIGRTVKEANSLRKLAEASEAVTGVGFSFRRLPGLAAVARAAREGKIGTVHNARVWYYADYAADPQGALSWRFDREQAGAGALLDIGAHAIDALSFVAGPVSEVQSALLRTVISERPKPAIGGVGHNAAISSESGPVSNDDIALLNVTLADGAVGQISLSRIAHGTPNSLGVEIYGSAGHLRFDSMSAGEFWIYTSADNEPEYSGARKVIVGPEQPYFSDVAAMPGGGVGTGYAEAFTAEIQEFVRSVSEGTPMETDFTTAAEMMSVVDAALISGAEDRPATVTPVGGN